jgi:choline dehydrogenase-like flavoprotein
VGRNFLETLFWTASGLHSQPLGSHRGVPADAICWDFGAPDSIPNIVGGFRMSMGAGQADLLGPIAYATRIVGGFGHAHRAAMKDAFGRTLTVTAIGEFLPNSDTYIDLHPESADRAGLPLPRINSQLTDVDLRRLTFMAEKCRAVLHAAGAEQIFEEYGSYDTFSSTHVFGTCRMGTDPQRSVVDASCRSHRWKNRLITGASVFPSTGSGEAPSLTIEALALRATKLYNI